MNGTTEDRRIRCLILAASRRGAEDAVARMKGVSHKCLAPIDGVVMLERVVRSLEDSGVIGDIHVSIESDDLLRSVPYLARRMDEGRLHRVAPRGNLADSVLAAAEAIEDPFPLVVCTGDNALQTPAIVRDFVAAFLAGSDDVAVGFTREEVVKAEFPDIGLAWHELKDGGWSACNLYGLRNRNALRAVEVFRSGGQFGKRHWRILKSCGVVPFILYKLKATTLEGLLDRIARNLGVTCDTVVLDHAYGPIDVDNPRFFEISEAALVRRRCAGEGHD